jgi:hypothetical protein
MANNENKASKPADKVTEDRVEIFVPKGYANEDPNYYVSVNGVNYVMPRGKKAVVPAHIAEEFYRSQRAQDRLDQTMEQMLEASK